MAEIVEKAKEEKQEKRGRGTRDEDTRGVSALSGRGVTKTTGLSNGRQLTFLPSVIFLL